MAKELVIKYINKASHSITNFPDSPFAGNHPKFIQNGTKAAAAEAAEMAAETEAAAQQEQTKRLATEFEAFGGGAYTAAQSVAVDATAAEAAAASKATTAAHEDRTPLEEAGLVRHSSGGAETMGKVDFAKFCRSE